VRDLFSSSSAREVASVSFLLLFTEMALIRWIPAEVRLLAYFSSVVLIACFLGQGVGCIARSRRDWMPAFPWLLLSLLVLVGHLGGAGVHNPAHGFFFRYGADSYSWLWAVPLVFGVCALALLPLGQRLARGLGLLEPLVGYTANLAGSLLGTVAFAVLATMEASPAWWFGVVAVVALLHLGRRPLVLLGGIAAGVATVLLVHAAARPFLWSPYYKIRLAPMRGAAGRAVAVTVNDDYHQMILDLSPASARSNRALANWGATYDFPYAFVRQAGAAVLVLGAGTGNDVAAALRHGARRVDAVELDPVIARLGRTLHPEHPYADSRVRVLIDDARSFVNTSRAKYDLIVFGWLDSHRVFSSLSNVRQDNFVYTVEGMRNAASHLAPEGALVVSFYAGKPWVAGKIAAMLRDATGHEPRAFALPNGGYGLDGVIFVVTADGRWPPRLPGGFTELTQRVDRLAASADPPTDRWPFLYWERPGLSFEYARVLLAILLVAGILVLPELRVSGFPAREGAHFFLLGAGFLLLEVRNITALALVFGSTWVVASVAVSAVLVMAMVATLLVARGWAERRVVAVWCALFASILLGLLWSRVGSAAVAPTVRAWVTTLVVSATFVFTGIVFARSFKRTAAPGTALGLNVLGAVVGGVAEFGSLLVGLDGLAAVAIVLYALAATTSPRI
jgi:hypothetical protein